MKGTQSLEHFVKEQQAARKELGSSGERAENHPERYKSIGFERSSKPISEEKQEAVEKVCGPELMGQRSQPLEMSRAVQAEEQSARNGLGQVRKARKGLEPY